METNIETLLVQDIRDSLREAVKARLSAGYNNPLDKVLTSIIDKQQSSITKIFEDACLAAVNAKDFKMDLNAAFSRKLAKVLLSKFEGEIEKRVNDIRTNPIMRAKITLAIEKAITEV